MGRTLGVRWSRAGHDVLFGSRDRGKAEAAARNGSPTARAGDFDDAAAFGQVVVYTVRGVFPSALLRNPRSLDGKIVIDCNNTEHFDAPPPPVTLAEQLAADAPRARIVKAFTTIPYPVLELGRDILAPHRISVFLIGDDPAAKNVVRELAEELGFIGVESGGLDRSRFVDGATDFLRFQIVAMGRGFFTTLSLDVLQEGQ
jgi:predicted dinucleotide-binding enzyme